MIDPATIDPFSLPFVSSSERSRLPRTSGVYFALAEAGQILYIGKKDSQLHSGHTSSALGAHSWGIASDPQ